MDRVCLECGLAVRGRADKKFCDDACRSAYNNRLNLKNTIYIKNINQILRKNRQILLSRNPDGKSKASKKQLMEQGFHFDYFTSKYTNKEGKTYYFCYDQGYLPIENDWFFLVKKQE